MERTEGVLKGLELSPDAFVRVQASKVLQKLPQIKELFRKAFTETAGLQIDFISQRHENIKGELDEWSADSQGVARRAIVEGNYDVVAIEGAWHEGPATEALVKEEYDKFIFLPGYAEHKRTLESLGVDFSSYERAQLPVATFMKMVKKPKDPPISRRMISDYRGEYLASEDIDLLFLGSSLTDAFQKNGQEKDAFVSISVFLRTELALAKTILAMREKGHKRAAIAQGSLHTDCFEFLAKELQLRSQIIDAEAWTPERRKKREIELKKRSE